MRVNFLGVWLKPLRCEVIALGVLASPLLAIADFFLSHHAVDSEAALERQNLGNLGDHGRRVGIPDVPALPVLVVVCFRDDRMPSILAPYRADGLDGHVL